MTYQSDQPEPQDLAGQDEAPARGLLVNQAKSFQFGKVIIHYVPANKVAAENPRQPDMSAEAVDLTPDLSTFFTERLTGTFGNKSVPVVEPPNEISLAPGVVKRLLPSPRRLVEDSQALAQLLFEVQSGVQTDGLIVVSRGSVKIGERRRPAVLVMKLAYTEGTRVPKDGDVYRPEQVRDLMFSRDTKLFKAAVITQREDGSLLGLVSDEQSMPASRMFRETFLGLKRARNADVVTREWWEATQTWIDETITDNPTHVRYSSALRVELTSNRNTINPRQFAQDYFAAEHADAYRRHLTDAGISLDGFEKSDKAFTGAEKRMVRKTSQHDFTITGPARDFAEHVVPEAEWEGEQVIVIRDSIKR